MQSLKRISVKILSPRNYFLLLSSGIMLACAPQAQQQETAYAVNLSTHDLDSPLTESYQLTFTGKRSGEAYFNPTADKIIYQAENASDNPFYQIYTMDLTSGEVERISGGSGKTTCGYFHPKSPRVLYASTHLDHQKEQKQKTERINRAHGKKKRYSWDFDPSFDIFTQDLKTKKLQQLTNAMGYDAEGAYSPDGEWIVFSSNRHAYEKYRKTSEQELLKKNPAHFMELYIMRHDGTGTKRLTQSPGYNGGPFFSPDGKNIVWRRFETNGHIAEIWTMRTDGTRKRQITQLGAMSWAPFYHPSGQYIIFTTNLHGYKNFELYIVDTQGEKKPYRVTKNEHFDGLPVFSPQGDLLSWTTTNHPENTSQIFFARWEHQKALQLLELSTRTTQSDHPKTTPDNTEQIEALQSHVEALCAPEMAGRKTGTSGEKKATSYVAKKFEEYNLETIDGHQSYFQTFDFKAGTSLNPETHLKIDSLTPFPEFRVEENWVPLEFSQSGSFSQKSLVFAGYGIVAPAQEQKGVSYNAYADKVDVKDRWVIVLRDMPQNISDAHRQHLLPFSSLRSKAITARNKGAKGIVFVTGPLSALSMNFSHLKIVAASLKAVSLL